MPPRKPLDVLHGRLFELAMDQYPKRPGNNRRVAANAWNARVREGVDPQDMLKGVLAYAAYCKANDTDPGYIKLASTFFGPSRFFEDDYEVQAQAPKQGGKPDAAAALWDFYQQEKVV